MTSTVDRGRVSSFFKRTPFSAFSIKALLAAGTSALFKALTYSIKMSFAAADSSSSMSPAAFDLPTMDATSTKTHSSGASIPDDEVIPPASPSILITTNTFEDASFDESTNNTVEGDRHPHSESSDSESEYDQDFEVSLEPVDPVGGASMSASEEELETGPEYIMIKAVDMENLRKERDGLLAKQRSLEKEARYWRSMFNQERLQVTSALELVDHLETWNQELTEERDDYMLALEESTEKCEDLEEEKDELLNTIQAAELQSERLSETALSLQWENQELLVSRDNYFAQLDHNNGYTRQLSADLQSLATVNDNLLSQTRELEVRNSLLQEKLVSAHVSSNQFEAQVRQLSQTLEAERTVHQVEKAAESRLRIAQQKHREQLAALEKKYVDENAAALERTTTLVNIQKSELKTMRGRMDQLRNTVRQLDQDFQSSQAENEALKNQQAAMLQHISAEYQRGQTDLAKFFINFPLAADDVFTELNQFIMSGRNYRSIKLGEPVSHETNKKVVFKIVQDGSAIDICIHPVPRNLQKQNVFKQAFNKLRRRC